MNQNQPGNEPTTLPIDLTIFSPLSLPQLIKLKAVLDRLLVLRREEETILQPASAPSPALLPKAEPPAAPDNYQRGQMRDPRPGTVRADIYTVLESVERMRFSQVVTAVAHLRGLESSEGLKHTVGKVLRNPFDPRICKFGPGEFGLRRDVAPADSHLAIAGVARVAA